MKEFKDYSGEEAIALIGDLLEPMTPIMADAELMDIIGSGKPMTIKGAALLKRHPNEVRNILLRIDPTPITAQNIMGRLLKAATQIMGTDKDFFASAEQGKTV